MDLLGSSSAGVGMGGGVVCERHTMTYNFIKQDATSAYITYGTSTVTYTTYNINEATYTYTISIQYNFF